jgi:hypothetical protein
MSITLMGSLSTYPYRLVSPPPNQIGSLASSRPPEAFAQQEIAVRQCVRGLGERAGLMQVRRGYRDPLRRVSDKQRGYVDARSEQRLNEAVGIGVVTNPFSHAVVSVLAAAHSTTGFLPRIARRAQRRAAVPRSRSRPHEPALELVRAAERSDTIESDMQPYDPEEACGEPPGTGGGRAGVRQTAALRCATQSWAPG